MPRLLPILACCLLLAGAAHAQTGNGVNSGVSGNAGTIYGSNVNVVNGINANGTPKQQSPGASMTVGAGNSTMIPGIAGGAINSPASPNAPSTGIATPTINGAPATP